MTLDKRELLKETLRGDGRIYDDRRRSLDKLVDGLDDTSPNVTQASPAASANEIKNALSALSSVVTLNFTSWNRIAHWLRSVQHLRAVA